MLLLQVAVQVGHSVKGGIAAEAMSAGVQLLDDPRNVQQRARVKHLEDVIIQRFRDMPSISSKGNALAVNDVLHQPIHLTEGFEAVPTDTASIERVPSSMPVLDYEFVAIEVVGKLTSILTFHTANVATKHKLFLIGPG